MNEYDLDRAKELLDQFPKLKEGDIGFLIEMENRLTRRNSMLGNLYESGIFTQAIFEDGIKRSFQTFLKEVVNNFGLDFCKKIYEYEPEEEIGFLNGAQQTAISTRIKDVRKCTSTLNKYILDGFYQDEELIRKSNDLISSIDRLDINS